MVECSYEDDRRYTRCALSGLEDQGCARTALYQGIDFAWRGKRSWKTQTEAEAAGGFAADSVETSGYPRDRQ